jgi:hypothetical protein
VGSGNRVTETSAVPGKGDGKLVDRLFPGFGESMRGIWVSARGTFLLFPRHCGTASGAPAGGASDHQTRRPRSCTQMCMH